ncbi:MAG TPA: 3-oxoacyl-ACP synthase [Bdellovibrionales bacterium]|nr:MAG: 3-oxoacyl-ACP synthase [Bdellovibrionales bacterium GWA1_52_35]OFZ42670.1 MAG: 3-oxoacyl-ACP synthase [Bdellovibrionales bacterium GWC1_52_8]HAR44252.1 3-oxoacyl-ACP synthase [Bdellovibrionales bacterium]HCM39338.1 3-oxoacyl-ACP synthase [Bdellovibrionales bacterium]
MTNLYASRITGTGSAFPKRRLTNLEIAQNIETSDEWIRERTGIVERRISEPGNPDELNSSLGLAAAKRALEMAGKRPEDIDQILYATASPDTIIPSTACWLQQKLGAKNAWALDMNAACSGFLYALTVADQFIKTGSSKTILVIGSEVLSTFVNWKDRGSCILFGDGAGAVIVERTTADSPSRIISSHLHSDGSFWELLHVPAGGSAMEVTAARHAEGLDKVHMKGKEIFKVAVKTLSDYAALALEVNHLKLSDLDWFIPHQANLRIIEAVAKRLDLPMEKVLLNIERFGNTSSATVPSMLDEAVRDGRIKSGQTVLMDVFGAGLTYGSVLVRW